MALITRDALANSVWGCGYGSRKHLIDHEKSKLRIPDSTGYHDAIQSQCKPPQFLTFIDKADPFGQLDKKKVCVRCQALLETQRAHLEAAEATP